MKSSTFTFTDGDGVSIFTYRWLPDSGSPRGIVQISHGMQEHAARYAEFAAFLTQNGYAVYANDHRGHGHTAIGLDKQGDLGPGGWDHTMLAIKLLSDRIKGEYPVVQSSIPFWHILASLLAQNYLERWGKELRGAVLCGTSGRDPVLRIGHLLAKRQVRKKGANLPCVLAKISIDGMNKAFEPARTPKDWLNRDENEVDKYIADPYCGKPFPSSFFLELTLLLLQTWSRKNEREIPKELPICFVTGSIVPGGKFTKAVKALGKRYEKYGLKDVTYKWYNGARHEALHETNKSQVMTDILGWLNNHLSLN